MIRALVLLLSLLCCSRAWAQGDVAAAREAEAQARVSFRERDYLAAARGFETAFRLDPKANTKYNEALAWRAAGEPAAAADAFEAALALGGLDDGLRDAGNDALAALRAELGILAVTAPAGATISVAHADHRRIPTRVHLAPGRHEVIAHYDGGAQAQRTVTLVAGGQTSLVFPEPAAEAPDPTPAPAPRLPADEGAPGLTIAGWTLVGVGAGSLVAMGITGGLTLGKVGDYDDGGHTDAALRDEAVTLRTTTNVLLGAGAGLVAVGAVLLLIDAFGDDDAGEVATRAGWRYSTPGVFRW